jgi:uncharacterized protein (TIGR02118 family)
MRGVLESKFFSRADDRYLNYISVTKSQHPRSSEATTTLNRTPSYQPTHPITMPVTATVLYPATPSSTFDMSYYLSSHMPLVAEKWGPFGLQAWSVVNLTNEHDGGLKPPYSVQATLVWDKAESIKTAIDKEGEVVFGDVKNFSNEAPVFMVGEVVGSS